jgi:Family of unknown function (DUF6186)
MIGRSTTMLVWAALGATAVMGQVVARLSDEGFPGLGTVVKRVTVSRVGRSVLVLAWMWLGWHAFAR